MEEKVSRHVFSPDAINSIILHKWWGDFQGDDTEAYTALCTALDNNKLKGMRKKLDIFSKKEARESKADSSVFESPSPGVIDSSEKMY